MQEIITSYSPQDTQQFGVQLAQSLQKGSIVALQGELGSGKTCLTQGIGQGLMVKTPITSPTYTLMQKYSGTLSLYHFDLYRIEDENELQDLGIDEYLFGDGVCIIEWSEKAQSYLPSDSIHIKLHIVDENKRMITFSR